MHVLKLVEPEVGIFYFGTMGREILQVRAYTLSCNFKAKLSDSEHHITGVCAPNSKLERRLVREELVHVRGLMEGPWDICGDFKI